MDKCQLLWWALTPMFFGKWSKSSIFKLLLSNLKYRNTFLYRPKPTERKSRQNKPKASNSQNIQVDLPNRAWDVMAESTPQLDTLQHRWLVTLQSLMSKCESAHDFDHQNEKSGLQWLEKQKGLEETMMTEQEALPVIPVHFLPRTRPTFEGDAYWQWFMSDWCGSTLVSWPAGVSPHTSQCSWNVNELSPCEHLRAGFDIFVGPDQISWPRPEKLGTGQMKVDPGQQKFDLGQDKRVRWQWSVSNLLAI